jgi:hypothetical protein
MAGFTANEVFRDIAEIARSGGSLGDRRARAERRIDEFKVDLGKQLPRPGDAQEIRGQLRTKIERVLNNRDIVGDIDSVFRTALDRLTGSTS